jgi:hypothetical protein
VPGNNPGLVNIQLASATLTCLSTGGGGTTATLNYSGTLVYYTQAGWKTVSINWTGGSDPLASVDLSQQVDSSGRKLSTYISSLAGSIGPTSSSGIQNVESAISVTTVPTIAGSAGSVIHVELGHLSCVAA